jgi:hypothetical protein
MTTLQTPNSKNSSHHSYSNSSKRKDILPQNFHQQVIELENNFNKEKSIETMNELLELYKVKLFFK